MLASACPNGKPYKWFSLHPVVAVLIACEQALCLGKKIARKGKGMGERACRHTFEAAIPPSCNYLAEHLSARSLSANQFRAWVTPGKIKGKTSVFCFVSKQSEMGREPNCRFWKKSLISGKRINTVPVVGVSWNKTLLVDSGQDSVVLAQAFDCSRFPLVQGESFSDLSCLTCAHRAVLFFWNVVSRWAQVVSFLCRMFKMITDSNLQIQSYKIQAQLKPKLHQLWRIAFWLGKLQPSVFLSIR